MFLKLKSLILMKISMMKFIFFLNIIFLSAIGLSGCGGGGANDNALPAVRFDSNNATETVRVVASVAFEMDEIGETGDFFDFTSSAEWSDPDAMATASRIAISSLDGATVKSIQIQEETSQCAESGSLTISGSIAGADSFTVGDIIQIDADRCDDGNATVDGQLQMTIANLEGDISTSNFLLGFNALFSDFSVTDDGGDTILNGDLGMIMDTRTPLVTEVNISGSNFSISGMGKTQSISNFSNLYTTNIGESPVAWVHSSQATISSSELAGTLIYQMPVSFEGSADNYPHTGELLITGADNATLRLITIDDDNVQIDADYDGDGVIDDTLYRTWIELIE